MIVLGIDPGFERLGIAVLEKEKNKKETLLFSCCFRTDKDLPHYQRLQLIGAEVKKTIERFKPDTLAIETLFLSSNQKTVMAVAETRGIILYESTLHNLHIKEFSPPQIKLTICGNGKADKKSIQKMIPLLLKIPTKTMLDDEYDAIAIGLTGIVLK